MSKLVMIIDDSLTVRKILEVTLRRAEIDSVSYPDGVEALRAVYQGRHPVPDVVLLDLGLPQMDGYEIARHLKTKPLFDQTSVIIVTAKDRVFDRLKGRLVGAKDYVIKPFRTQEVVSIVTTHLRLTPSIERLG